MHQIKVTGIKCYANHGCLPEETAIGGHYIVDVVLFTDFTAAAQNDDLSKTIDYVDVARIVNEEMAIPSKLIETVGQRIITRFGSELNGLENVTLEIHKINPPINADVKEVSIVMSLK